MSRRRPVTPAKETHDTIVVQSNGSPSSRIHPVSPQDPTEAKLLAYVHDERHFSFVRYHPVAIGVLNSGRD